MAVSGKTGRRWEWAALFLGTVVVLRLATLGVPGLTDNTESRYATIGWEMFRTGDWVTPRLWIKGALVPFWGKPPLQFWLTAASFRLFGVGEGAARVPSVVGAWAALGFTWLGARRLWDDRVAALAVLILASSGLFFVLSGACVLDVPLAASVTASLASFSLFGREPAARGWGVAFFLALAVGMLAKGPVALVLVGLTLVFWLTLAGRWRLLLALPWGVGTGCFLAVAVPWYVLAERATPGFLRYFLLNEHVLRYVSSKYGDLYGSGRVQPYGASWVLLAGGFLPWTALAVAAVARLARPGRWRETLRLDPWFSFWLLWGVTPALFFTLARQMLVTYLLPGLPGLAVATAVGVVRWADSEHAARLASWLRGHVAALAAGLAGGAVAAFVSGFSSPWVAVGGCAAAGALLAAGLGRVRRADVVGCVGVLAVASSALVAGATWVLAPRIDEEFSSKTVLAAASAASPVGSGPFLLPFGDEYSALFYAEAVGGRRLEHSGKEGEPLLLRRLDAGGRELFLFKRKQWRRLTPAALGRLVVVAETPHWVVGSGVSGRPVPPPGP